MKKLLPSLLLLASLQASAQTPTLIAHWNFQNGSTTDLVNGWTSVVTGSPTPAPGVSGAANTALKFNVGDYLRVASNSKMNLTSWTITALVKPEGFNANICQGNSILRRGREHQGEHMGLGYTDNFYDNDCGTATPAKNILYGTAAGHTAAAPVDFISSHPQTPNPFITSGTWYCFAAAYDGIAGTMTFYLDGVQVSAALPWTNQYAFSQSTVQDLIIGANNEPTGTHPYFLNAVVDNIKIYNGVLSVSGDQQVPCTYLDGGNTDPETTSVAKPLVREQLNIFPNPATDNITIAVPAHMQSGKVIITNTVGAVVKQVAATQSTIDTHELPAGLYMIRLQSNGEIATAKFTIVK